MGLQTVVLVRYNHRLYIQNRHVNWEIELWRRVWSWRNCCAPNGVEALLSKGIKVIPELWNGNAECNAKK